MDWDLILQIAGLTIGVIYLWFEYHASRWLWPVSVIMPMISLWLYWRKGLYADFAINIYYVAIAVYGWIAWSVSLKSDKAKKEEPALPVTHIRFVPGVCCAAVFAVLWIAIAQFLIHCTNSTVPWTDAFTTALSIVAMWMLARKYAEQWLAWLVVDAVCVGLYLYKEIPLYALLYLAYTVIAVFGYRKWLRMIKKE